MANISTNMKHEFKTDKKSSTTWKVKAVNREPFLFCPFKATQGYNPFNAPWQLILLYN